MRSFINMYHVVEWTGFPYSIYTFVRFLCGNNAFIGTDSILHLKKVKGCTFSTTIPRLIFVYVYMWKFMWMWKSQNTHTAAQSRLVVWPFLITIKAIRGSQKNTKYYSGTPIRNKWQELAHSHIYQVIVWLILPKYVLLSYNSLIQAASVYTNSLFFPPDIVNLAVTEPDTQTNANRNKMSMIQYLILYCKVFSLLRFMQMW